MMQAARKAREEARARMLAAEAAWLRSRDRCVCPRVLLGRVYDGVYACALCGRLTGLRQAALRRNQRQAHAPPISPS